MEHNVEYNKIIITGKLTSAKKVCSGMMFLIDGDLYMVSAISAADYRLIELSDGNRFNESNIFGKCVHEIVADIKANDDWEVKYMGYGAIQVTPYDTK